jgi:hypothetical protein
VLTREREREREDGRKREIKREGLYVVRYVMLVEMQSEQ